jgi:hypothetical protein
VRGNCFFFCWYWRRCWSSLLKLFSWLVSIHFSLNLSEWVTGQHSLQSESEWVSVWCLMSSEQFFRYIMLRTCYFSMWWRWWCSFVLNNTPSWILIAHWNKNPQADMSNCIRYAWLFGYCQGQIVNVMVTDLITKENWQFGESHRKWTADSTK